MAGKAQDIIADWPEYLVTREVKEITGLHENSIYRHVKTDSIKCLRGPSGRLLYPKLDIYYLAQRVKAGRKK